MRELIAGPARNQLTDDIRPYCGVVEAGERKRLGAWYTPAALVDAVCREAVFAGARSALDPACGDGRFLAATGLADLTGVDIDPRTDFIRDDSLKRDWGGRQWDVVVGNPPFLNQLSSETRRTGRSRFGGGAYADAAAEFLALAITLARPGGRVGLVLPQSILAGRDTAGIRRFVDERAALRWMWWSDTPMFDAKVRVWAGVWEVGARPGVVRRAVGADFSAIGSVTMPPTWAGLLAEHDPPEATGRTLGEIATFAADFRDQYYGLVDAVSDEGIGPPLITSGLIEPGRVLWSERPTRFAKRRFEAPQVDLDRLSPAMRAWAAGRLVSKILIANQTRVIEAVHDPTGAWLPCVPVLTCVTDRPDAVLAALNSDRANQWVRYHAAGTGLSARAVRLSPSLLASIPID